jgi:Arc/MetJ-type ribon-helix-helix transcriptional regulator
MSTQTLNISLPKELVKKIDHVAKAGLDTRSGYIRRAIIDKLNADRGQDWDLLDALSMDIAHNASAHGYKTDEDFVQAVKEVRSARLANSANK